MDLFHEEPRLRECFYCLDNKLLHPPFLFDTTYVPEINERVFVCRKVHCIKHWRWNVSPNDQAFVAAIEAQFPTATNVPTPTPYSEEDSSDDSHDDPEHMHDLARLRSLMMSHVLQQLAGQGPIQVNVDGGEPQYMMVEQTNAATNPDEQTFNIGIVF